MKPVNFNQLAEGIIQELPEEFDSHDFIEAFLTKHEHTYVKWLCEYQNVDSGIFRTLHSQIALCLSKDAEHFKIIKKDKCDSENIKNYLSENQTWRKLKCQEEELLPATGR